VAKKRINRGISLLETLIAISLLAILTTYFWIDVPSLRGRVYDAVRKSDLEKIKVALEDYYARVDSYPSALPSCGQPFSYSNSETTSPIPCDPVTKLPYPYQVLSTGQSYRLYTTLFNKQDYSITKVGCQGGCGSQCQYNYGVSSPGTTLEKCSYVCAPGGGKSGSCEQYHDPDRSQCPKLYLADPTCASECSKPQNRCKNASGKQHLQE